MSVPTFRPAFRPAHPFAVTAQHAGVLMSVLLLLLLLLPGEGSSRESPQESRDVSIATVLADESGDGRPDRLNEVVTVTGVVSAEALSGPGYSQTHLQGVSGGLELLALDGPPPSMDSLFRARGVPTFEPVRLGAFDEGDVVTARGLLIEVEQRPQLLVHSVERIGRVTPPEARETVVAELHRGDHRDVLVRVRGELRATSEGPEAARLEDGTGSIPVLVAPDLLGDAEFGPRLAEGMIVDLTAFAEPVYRGPEGLEYRLSVDGRHDITARARPPYGAVATGVAFALLLMALIYVAGRRSAAERKSSEMERMVSQQRLTQESLERSQRALRTSEEQLRSLVEHAPFGVFRAGSDGKLLLVNEALVEMLGYESDFELGELELESDVFQNPGDWEALKGSLQAGTMEPVVTVPWVARDGSGVSVRIRVHALDRGGSSELILEGFVENVTERQRLEERLRQSQKMEAVGQLAGGVAHDFNNLLTVILGSCEFLLSDGPSAEVRAEVEEIQTAGSRAAALTRQLLAFSRRQPLAPQILCPSKAMESSYELLRRVVEKDVELVLDLTPDLDCVRVDPVQLQQVIINLVVNARDSMLDGGTIRIETDRALIEEDFLRRHPTAQPGRYVRITVADDGEGMDRDTLARIFEPFFTTKGDSGGTGLGLATVYGIVTQSGGYIFAESEPGAGSTFYVYLPVVEGGPSCDAGDWPQAVRNERKRASPSALPAPAR